jgi:polysaccharide pyruvyl transferase WcaK-like protein
VYVLLVGQRGNAGDHLIVARVLHLLETHRPDRSLVLLPRWEPLDSKLETVNAARALILCGGPAVQPDMYPGVFPLVADLEQIEVPIVPFGLGWKGIPGDELNLQSFRYLRAAEPLVTCLRTQKITGSCRDHLTHRVLKKWGIPAVMTGDPAWYHLPTLNRSDHNPPSGHIGRIVLSAPAGTAFHRQSVSLAHRLRREWPDAHITATFHHGWEPSAYLSVTAATVFRGLRDAISAAGVDTLDIAADYEAMEAALVESDLHVGYRLHAHLACLSRHRPSFLLEEDGRGRGASEALGLRGVAAWERPWPPSIVRRVSRWRLPARLRQTLNAHRARAEAIDEVCNYVREEVSAGFPRLAGAAASIEHTYGAAMLPFLRSLP